MKKIALALFTLAAAVAPLCAAPQVSAEQAVKIATQYLKENSRTESWITSVTYEGGSIAGSKPVWAVKWNTPVALSDTKRETGLEISMDGSYARYTEKVANANTPGVVGVPADRGELLNHRTRTGRPSILDLKH